MQGGVTPVPSVLPSATAVKLSQDGKWPLTFDFHKDLQILLSFPDIYQKQDHL